jgi:guanylate kinase
LSHQGILTILSGFSGSGKGTIVRELLAQHPDEFALSVSATTRAPREGEKEGISYFFKSKEEFEQMILQDELLEYAQYVDHYYGTPRAYVDRQLAAGKNVILEIEVQGAMKIREKYPDTLLLFVTPPSAEELKQRLVGRDTETADVILSRLSRAYEEADGCEAYDYLIINDQLDTCVRQVYDLIKNEKHRMIYNMDRIRRIKEELRAFSKGEH